VFAVYYWFRVWFNIFIPEDGGVVILHNINGLSSNYTPMQFNMQNSFLLR
jgi:hypothetical protein